MFLSIGHYSTACIGHLLCTMLCGNVGSVPGVWPAQYWVTMVTCLWPGLGGADIYLLPVLLTARSRSRHGPLLWCDLTSLLKDMTSVCMFRKRGALEASHVSSPAGRACSVAHLILRGLVCRQAQGVLHGTWGASSFQTFRNKSVREWAGQLWGWGGAKGNPVGTLFL